MEHAAIGSRRGVPSPRDVFRTRRGGRAHLVKIKRLGPPERAAVGGKLPFVDPRSARLRLPGVAQTSAHVSESKLSRRSRRIPTHSMFCRCLRSINGVWTGFAKPKKTRRHSRRSGGIPPARRFLEAFLRHIRAISTAQAWRPEHGKNPHGSVVMPSKNACQQRAVRS